MCGSGTLVEVNRQLSAVGSLLYVDLWDGTQVVSAGSKYLHLRNHFTSTSPEFLFEAIFLSQENSKDSLNGYLPSISYRRFLNWAQMKIDGL